MPLTIELTLVDDPHLPIVSATTTGRTANIVAGGVDMANFTDLTKTSRYMVYSKCNGQM